jgi:hypothetical protein
MRIDAMYRGQGEDVVIIHSHHLCIDGLVCRRPISTKMSKVHTIAASGFATGTNELVSVKSHQADISMIALDLRTLLDPLSSSTTFYLKKLTSAA